MRTPRHTTPATIAQVEPVTVAQLAKMISRHRVTVEKWIARYNLPLIGVRIDGHHLQHALSPEDAAKFLELRKADGFR